MAGVFIIRVCEWSVNFLSDVLSFRNYKPDVHLAFSEQTAMELILQQERNKKHVAYIPQQWINNYRVDTAENFMNRQDANGMGYWVARRGDFIVHFAGSGNKKGDILEYSGRQQTQLIKSNPILRPASRGVALAHKGLMYAPVLEMGFEADAEDWLDAADEVPGTGRVAGGAA
ncbi:hypothetical protein NHJ6243_008276 [Beauveria neobassiana]